MSQFKRHVEAIGNDGVEAAREVSETAGSVVQAVTDRATAAAQQVRKTAGRAVEAVEEKYEHAADSIRKGRDRVEHWEKDFEGAVASKPIISLLIAAGLGVVIGMLWDRRRR